MTKKNNSKSAKEKTMAPSELLFSEIDYEILNLKFEYSFAQNPVFQAVIDLKVPDEYINYPIKLTVPIPNLVAMVAMTNEPMAQYVQRVIDSFDDSVSREKLAFESLKEEGFDLEQFVRCALQMVSIDPNAIPPSNKTTEKILDLNDVPFDIAEVGMGYRDTNPPVCVFKVQLIVPEHVFNQPIELGFELADCLRLVEKKDASMANYFKQALATYEGESDSEILTIQSLVSEGFDFSQFLIYAIKQHQVKIKQTVS